MAQLISLNVYQINSKDPTPLADVKPTVFPTAGILVGGTNVLLTSGIRVYSEVRLIATGAVYKCVETPAAILALGNA